MRHPEPLRELALGRVEVDADDDVGPHQTQALDDVETDPAETEDHAVRARLDLRGVDHRPDAGSDAAPDVADLVERRVLAHLRQRNLGQHRVVGEGRRPHVVKYGVPADAEPAGAVGHHPASLGLADRLAEVGLAAQAVVALSALGGVEGDDVVARLDAGDARADLDHDSRALVPEDGGEQPFGVGAGEGELVGVTDAGRLDLDQHLAGLRSREGHGLDGQRLACLVGDRGSGFHGAALLEGSFDRPAGKLSHSTRRFRTTNLRFRLASEPGAGVARHPCSVQANGFPPSRE